MLYIKHLKVSSKIDNTKVTKGVVYTVLALHQNGEELLVSDDNDDLTWLKFTDVSVFSKPESFIMNEMADECRNTVIKTVKTFRKPKNTEQKELVTKAK